MTTRIALDTETTGLDLRHGARPFLVTIATENDENIFWEWPVDPYTRKVKVNRDDLVEIMQWCHEADEIVFQNPKFDVLGLKLLCQDNDVEFEWDWLKVRDTLLAGHLIASNQPHDLTTMVMIYLGIDVLPFENGIKEAAIKCRRLAQGKNPKYNFRIATKGLPEMPSAKDKPWKNDMWLPCAVAKLLKYPKDHEYWALCSEYANSDSLTTLRLYERFCEIIAERGLEKIYAERLKVLPIVHSMESDGITLSGKRLKDLQAEYTVETAEAGQVCVSIAKSYGYDLSLPKSGNNNSLYDFCFGKDTLNLEPVEVSKKTGKSSLNARCMGEYMATLPEGKPRKFLTKLLEKRKRDTALQYMEGYRKFWQPIARLGKGKLYKADKRKEWYVLHPSLNPTGTDTLRWSSANPNEQNISKKEGFNLRYCFGPAPGRVWYSIDANNIELRIPAYESGEKSLIELFENPGRAPYYGSTHLLNFHTVYPDIWAKEAKIVGPDKVGFHCKKKYASTWYQWCKNGGFAVQYGAMDRTDKLGTADKAFHRAGSHSKLKARFSKLEAHNKKCIAFAKKHGYIEAMIDKNVEPERGYPLMCTGNKWGQRVSPTIPLNYRTQSTAMWWMQSAMIRCYDFLQNHPSCRMIMQVHDEIVFDLPKGKTPKSNLPMINTLRKLMEKGGKDIGLPTPCSVDYHPNNWSEGVEV